MGVLNNAALTLADWAKRLDPDGKTSTVVELLAKTNEILIDQVWQEGNLPTGHRTTVRTGLPSVAWRLLNAGVQPSKSTTAQVDEATGMLEAYSEVDKDLAELNGNTSSFRLSEAQAFIEAMNHEMASKLFYGNSSTAPEQFNGLAVRYSSLSADNASHIINAGGSTSTMSSIWLVTWGPQTCFGVFPKGSKAGLIHEDLGLVTVETATGIAGSRLRAYRDHWQWKCGIALRDWRYVARIANIDIPTLTANSSPPDLIQSMIKAIHRMPNLRMGKLAFYMNRTCYEYLDIQRFDTVSNNAGMTFQFVDGVNTPMFRGIPIRICDAITETETQIS